MTQITHLKSSIDFAETLSECSDADYRRLRTNNDALLKQPPTLDMFVAVGEDGEVMSEPKVWKAKSADQYIPDAYLLEYDIYTEAKQRCLFEGVDIVRINLMVNVLKYKDYSIAYKEPNVDWYFNPQIKTISDLTPFNLPLTQTALNKIYQ